MTTNFPQKGKKFEIQSYKRPKDLANFRKTHLPFTGSPQKHPYDSKKFILVPDPYSSNSYYFEFMIEDIAFVEELPNLVNLEGKVVTMARIWVKKMRMGLQCLPFVVADPEDINK
ncbi:MAG: inorganic pyrophosphatase Ppa [Proteobacteria bacterium]|nr:inorganic pyrophosphatase Ppa [Pseudomonadota bacterium]